MSGALKLSSGYGVRVFYRSKGVRPEKVMLLVRPDGKLAAVYSAPPFYLHPLVFRHALEHAVLADMRALKARGESG